MFFYQPGILIVLPALLVVFWAQSKVKSTFNKYLKVQNKNNYSGAQIARDILNNNGLSNIRVEKTKGELDDHYDPKKKVVRLSPEVHDGRSIASVGVAAHETGHAIQHAKNYAPLGFRNAIFPVANLGSRLGLPLAIFGFFFRSENMILIGIIFYIAAVLFQIATLPVEFNASSRAISILKKGGYVDTDEVGPTKKVLNAAALTYVAATLAAIAQLIRLLVLYGASDD